MINVSKWFIVLEIYRYTYIRNKRRDPKLNVNVCVTIIFCRFN